MRSFFRRFFRSVKDPRYRVTGPDPFPTFAEFVSAYKAHCDAFIRRVHWSVPRNDQLFALAHEDFLQRYYPRLKWPDWMAAIVFIGTCEVILLATTMLSNWAVIAPTVLLGVVSGRAWKQHQVNRKWKTDKERDFHFRRQRSVTWEYQ
jgi:hypothetical protein